MFIHLWASAVVPPTHSDQIQRCKMNPTTCGKKRESQGGENSQTAPLFTQTFHTAKKEEKRKLCTGRKKIPIVCTILAYTLFTSLLQIKSTKKKRKKKK